VLLGLSVALIYKIRSSIAVVVIFAGFISLAVNYCSRKKRYILIILGLSFLLVFLKWHSVSRLFNNYIGFPSCSVFEALNQAHQVRLWAAETAFLPDADISTPLTFVLNAPGFLLYILFAPFPWAVTKLKHIFGTAEMLIWIVLFFFMLKGVALSIRYRLQESLFILIFILVMILSFFGEGNVGTLFRHRALIWPVFFIFTAVGLSQDIGNSKKKISRGGVL